MKPDKKVSRNKFLYWAFGITVVISIPAFFSRKNKTQKIKMLTEDGKLVEIDASAIPSKKKKLPDHDIHTWIKRS